MANGWYYLETIRKMDPALAERVLRAAGHRGVGNRIPGVVILRDEAGWNIHEAFDLITELQRWSRIVFEGSYFPSFHWWLHHLEYRLQTGRERWLARGNTGECPCLMCRVRRMWVHDLEEALSEY